MVVRRSSRPLAPLVCLCFFSGLSATASADSFGLTMGLSSEDLETAKDKEAPAGMLRLLSVPIPVTAYKTHIAQFSDDQGLCWVKGIGHQFQTDPAGKVAKAAFTVEKVRLGNTFGDAKNYDFRFSGRADSDLEKWMLGISSGDRYVAALWEESDSAELPENVLSVGLVLNGVASEIAYLSLEYTFKNIELCETEVRQKH